MSDRCKYCGAVKLFDDEDIDGDFSQFACGSEQYSDGSWVQSVGCSNSQEKLVTSPDEYDAAVLSQIPTAWLWHAEKLRVIEVLRRCGVSVDDAVRVITEVWEGDSNG